jgi:predicted small secreted protein
MRRHEASVHIRFTATRLVMLATLLLPILLAACGPGNGGSGGGGNGY